MWDFKGSSASSLTGKQLRSLKLCRREWQTASFPELAEWNGKQLRSLSLPNGMANSFVP